MSWTCYYDMTNEEAASLLNREANKEADRPSRSTQFVEKANALARWIVEHPEEKVVGIENKETLQILLKGSRYARAYKTKSGYQVRIIP